MDTQLITFTQLKKEYHFPTKVAEMIPVEKTYINKYKNECRLYSPSVVQEWVDKYAESIEKTKAKSEKAKIKMEITLKNRLDSLISDLEINLPKTESALIKICRKFFSEFQAERMLDYTFQEANKINIIRHNLTNYDFLWCSASAVYRHDEFREIVNDIILKTIKDTYNKNLDEIFE